MYSNQDHRDVVRLDVWDPPVVKVVVEGSVADSEFVELQELFVVHDVEGVVDVVSFLLCDDEGLLHHIYQLVFLCNGVISVCNMQSFFFNVLQD